MIRVEFKKTKFIFFAKDIKPLKSVFPVICKPFLFITCIEFIRSVFVMATPSQTNCSSGDIY